MSIRVALHHQTEYLYPRKISLGPHLIRLKPAYHGRTPVLAYGLNVEPGEHFINWQQDPFGNPIARFVFPKPADALRITVDLIADLTVINPFDFFIEEGCDRWPFSYDQGLLAQLQPYLVPPPPSRMLDEWVAQFPRTCEGLVPFLVTVNEQFRSQIQYLVRLEPGVQCPEETLARQSGSCRDTAWLMIQSFRRLGLAARFVSGYLIQLTADQKPLEGPAGPAADFCDLHAWAEVYLPGAGWVGLDPTSGLFAGEGHIPLACTPSYLDAAPVTGGHEPCEVEFTHAMSVRRVHETPRVTKPYSDQQWSAIMRLGEEVDRRLADQDVRLTMGGEPTFVATDNRDDPQWTTDAVGHEKRVLSNLLLLRLRERFAPGGLLHYGQGKWYPGESLPRWALTCLWRCDGHPVWQDPQWLADEGSDYGHTHHEGRRFLRALARRLNISVKMTFPVYEDSFHYLWRESRLPIDTDPLDPKLDDPNERAMMIRAFKNGLSNPAGYVLPLRRAWWQAQATWIGGRWPVRSEPIFLLPGDSPIGLRLPLDTLPLGALAGQSDYTTPLDPTAIQAPLPEPVAGNQFVRHSSSRFAVASVGGSAGLALNPQQLDEEDDDDLPTSEDIVHTALCVQCRHGRLYVFLPPTQRADDYLELVSAIEATCGETKLPVILEGYLPPADPRLQYFKVTPDPGVIEVNTHPSANWQELVARTETLYEEARQCRLGTERFDLDGLHTGTGGGNHLVLGGASPLDSPFLRRPDLLASLIAYWNNHPSLSYLFSGRFVGPTSQAPRADEHRPEAVYELEIALAQLPRHSPPPAWLVDRIFRDLLTDYSGNTHRSEICIDKLYSPDSSSGRLGLVELRGFEMPPHARMSLTQQLLIRALIAMFWEQPYRRPLVQWGTGLHDRFLLPFFVWRDFTEVCRELNAAGLAIDPDWFAVHHQFRFQPIGEVTYGDATLRLRTAIEPWHVLGEQPGSGGTARYVDSSLERIELLVDQLDTTRFAVLCNGIQVPLHATGTPGQFVAGIRYRAWQPPRCLHPTIGIHAPLNFDLFDIGQGRSVGGCAYHVVHPGGRGTEVFPVNANEAEARRAARFQRQSMLGGHIEIKRPPPHPGPDPYPVTLDLRTQ